MTSHIVSYPGSIGTWLELLILQTLNPGNRVTSGNMEEYGGVKHIRTSREDLDNVLYFARDPRDVFIANFYSAGNTDPKEFSTYLKPGMLRQWKFHVESWMLSNPDLKGFCKYETMCGRPSASLDTILRLLELPNIVDDILNALNVHPRMGNTYIRKMYYTEEMETQLLEDLHDPMMILGYIERNV